MTDINSINFSQTPSFVEGRSLEPLALFNHISKIGQEALQSMQQASTKLFNYIQNKVANTPLSPLIDKINQSFPPIETIFNIAGCVPLVGIVSGTLHTLWGHAEIIVGVSLLALSEIASLFNKISNPNTILHAKWNLLSKLGLELTIHGCLNVLKGSCEILISNYTFGLGNVIFLVPNLYNKQDFAPYFPYGSLTGSSPIDNI